MKLELDARRAEQFETRMAEFGAWMHHFQLGDAVFTGYPYQHLVNLYRIARRAVVIYTMTHCHPFAKAFWSMTIEDAEWITKATASVSWTPHYLEVARICRAIGFKRIAVVYPSLFLKHFPDIASAASRWTDVKLLTAQTLHRLTGIAAGHMRNFSADIMRMSNLNPNYVAYVCEK